MNKNIENTEKHTDPEVEFVTQPEPATEPKPAANVVTRLPEIKPSALSQQEFIAPESDARLAAQQYQYDDPLAFLYANPLALAPEPLPLITATTNKISLAVLKHHFQTPTIAFPTTINNPSPEEFFYEQANKEKGNILCDLGFTEATFA
jgi:hypothetical protein